MIQISNLSSFNYYRPGVQSSGIVQGHSLSQGVIQIALSVHGASSYHFQTTGGEIVILEIITLDFAREMRAVDFTACANGKDHNAILNHQYQDLYPVSLYS